MLDDRIETNCKPCGYAGHLPEGAFCPACGEGPAIPSRERVEPLYGLPVRMPTDPAGRVAALPGTRPARQTIPLRPATRNSAGVPATSATHERAGSVGSSPEIRVLAARRGAEDGNPTPTHPAPVKRRGRSVSDLPGAYDAAIRKLRSDHAKMTWPAVAAAMAAALGIPIDPSTLRGWCKEDGLPHPGVRERDLRSDRA